MLIQVLQFHKSNENLGEFFVSFKYKPNFIEKLFNKEKEHIKEYYVSEHGKSIYDLILKKTTNLSLAEKYAIKLFTNREKQKTCSI